VASFTLSPVESGIVRCHHTGAFTPEDVRALARFLEDYSGLLLIDLSGTTGANCVRNIKQFRPIMPTAAVFGTELDPSIFEIEESYYIHPVRYFGTEAEALAWLRERIGGIVRFKHTNDFSPECVRRFSKFLTDHQNARLLLDLSEAHDDCVKHIKQLRPMMPTTAIIGRKFDEELFKVPDSYYIHPVEFFDDEAEAIAWLHGQN
jgi:hypothetical protein